MNFAIRIWWLEPQSAPGLVFADCIEGSILSFICLYQPSLGGKKTEEDRICEWVGNNHYVLSSGEKSVTLLSHLSLLWSAEMLPRRRARGPTASLTSFCISMSSLLPSPETKTGKGEKMEKGWSFTVLILKGHNKSLWVTVSEAGGLEPAHRLCAVFDQPSHPSKLKRKNGNSDYFIFLDPTADGDCSHEIKRHLLFGWKAMANLDSVFKSRGITLPTKVKRVKVMVFLGVMYRCEIWTIREAENQRIDAFKL